MHDIFSSAPLHRKPFPPTWYIDTLVHRGIALPQERSLITEIDFMDQDIADLALGELSCEESYDRAMHLLMQQPTNLMYLSFAYESTGDVQLRQAISFAMWEVMLPHVAHWQPTDWSDTDDEFELMCALCAVSTTLLQRSSWRVAADFLDRYQIFSKETASSLRVMFMKRFIRDASKSALQDSTAVVSRLRKFATATDRASLASAELAGLWLASGVSTALVEQLRSMTKRYPLLPPLLAGDHSITHNVNPSSAAFRHSFVAMDALKEFESTIPGLQLACHRVVALQFDLRRLQQEQPHVPASGSSDIRDLHRLLARRKFTSRQDLDAYLKTLSATDIPSIPLEDLTPEELVEDLVDQARSYPRHERIRVLRELVRDHPTVLLPYLDLSAILPTARERYDMAAAGRAAGSHFEEPEFLTLHRGHFIEMPETRLFLHVLSNLSRALYDLGRIDESNDVSYTILDLDEDDALGIRYGLSCTLLEFPTPTSLMRCADLFSRYDEDDSAYFAWNRVLYDIVSKQPRETFDADVAAAVKTNQHIKAAILSQNVPPFDPNAPHMIENGSLEECRTYIRMSALAWRATVGAWAALME